jgi:hypothetical protein
MGETWDQRPASPVSPDVAYLLRGKDHGSWRCPTCTVPDAVRIAASGKPHIPHPSGCLWVPETLSLS